MADLLALEDLCVTYRSGRGDLPAVRNVDLTVSAGEIVGLAGESGCGKSTLASVVLRLQPPSARVTGRVRVLGEDVLTMPWGRLRTVRWAGAAIIFQGALHSLNPVQRVGDQVAEPILLHEPGVAAEVVRCRVAELFAQVGMPEDRIRAYPHQLSGGQKQRVMIAMALACRPDLVIADEPTTALDVMVQAQVLSVLSETVRTLGVGMLLISHDLSVLADICDRIVVMYAGRVIETGLASEVFSDPLHPYSAALSASFPRVGDPAARYRPFGLAGDPPDPTAPPAGCRFNPRCHKVVDACRDAEPPLVTIGTTRSAACLRIGTP